MPSAPPHAPVPAGHLAPEGFEIVENPERLFDPHATLIMRAIRVPDLSHGLDIWINQLLEKPVLDVVWTSSRGVKAAFRRAARSGQDFAFARHLSTCELYVLGRDTADALRTLGLKPKVVSHDPDALVRLLPARYFHRRRVALQLDAAHRDRATSDRHPLARFLRSARAKTYSIKVGTPKAA